MHFGLAATKTDPEAGESSSIKSLNLEHTARQTLKFNLALIMLHEIKC